MIFLTGSGTLSFTISGALGNATSITSPSSFADGAWHFVVGTMTGGLGGTQTLYVDGAAVASQTIALQLTSYTGYWRVGQNVNTGGGGNFFSGSISDAATWPGVMTAAQVTTLYGLTTQAAYASALAGTAPDNFWPLTDTGTGTFSGTLPAPETTLPCTHVEVTVGTSARCIYPAAAAACAAPSESALLSTLVAAGALAMTPPSPTTAQTITTTVARATAYTAFDAGLHLLVPVTISQTNFTASFTWPANQVENTP
jgi:hypothetical protein